MKKLIVILCFISTPSFACYYNSDCYQSGVCIKGAGQVYGTCAGPTNKYGSEDYTKKGLIDTRKEIQKRLEDEQMVQDILNGDLE